MILKRIFVSAVLLCAAGSACLAGPEGLKQELAETVEVTASVNSTSVLIGDRIYYDLSVDVPKGSEVEVIVADQDEQWGGLSLREFEESDPKPFGKNREKISRRYILESLVPGSYLIPAHQVLVSEPGAEPVMVSSQEIFVQVQSSLEDGNELELRGIKPPVDVDRNYRPLLIILFIVIIVSAAGWLIMSRFRYRQDRAPEPEPVLAPDAEALEELKKIKADDLINRSRTKEYYYRISGCIRFYIERRFGIRAPESSTEEFVEEAIRSQVLEGRHINLLKEFLSACDLVKYAGTDSDAAQADEVYRTAENFVLETRLPETDPAESRKVKT